MSLVLSRTRDGFASDYTWENERGVTFRSPRYSHTGGYTFLDCREALEDALVDLSVRFLSIEIELGERYAHKTPPPYCPEAPPSSPTSTPAPCPPATRWDIWPERPPAPLRKPEPDPPTPLDRYPVALRFGLSGGPELVASGWGSFGFAAKVGARYGPVSLDVEAHGDPSIGSVPSLDGPVSFARASGAALLCGFYGWFEACGIGEAGRILFPGHVPALPPSTFYSAAGVRAGFLFPLAPPRLFLGTSVDVLAPIHPASFAQMGGTIFQVASPAAGLHLSLLLELGR